MKPIVYTRGDATAPQGEGNKIIAHICTDRGGWGKGFVGALSRRWPEPEAAFRAWYKGRAQNDFALGAVQYVQVEPVLLVANMLAQHGYPSTRQGASDPLRGPGNVSEESSRKGENAECLGIHAAYRVRACRRDVGTGRTDHPPYSVRK